MKNIQKNKKSWFKGLVVASVFTISVLNLSIDVQHDANGNIDLATLSISSQYVSADEGLESDEGGGSGGINCAMVSTNRCMVTSYFDWVCMYRISQCHYGLRN